MLICSNENDDSSTFLDDDGNLVVVDDLIQSGWNEVDFDSTIIADETDALNNSNIENNSTMSVRNNNNNHNSGILIVPAGPEDVSLDGEDDILIPHDELLPRIPGNLSIPSSIPTSLPTILPDGFTKVSSNLSTNMYDDEEVSEMHSSSSKSENRVIRTANNIYNNVMGNNNFGSRRGGQIFLLTIVLTSAITTLPILYLVQERNSWRATTNRLEEKVREIQKDNEGRLLAEQQKRYAREQAAHDEQYLLATKLHDVMERLKKEDEARILEKEKAEILEREVRRLQSEVSALDQESKRAKELEAMVLQLKKEAEDREFQRQRAAKLEEEMRNLQNELSKNKRTSRGKSFFSKDDSDSDSYQKSSEEGKRSKLDDSCRMQSDGKMEFGECARKAGDSATQKIKEWSETLSKAHDKVKERMVQDYNDIKEMLKQTNDATDDEPINTNNPGQKRKLEEDNDNGESQFLNGESITKLWKEVGGTLSKAHERVMDQMAKDYNDIKTWYNDFLSNFESNDEQEEEPETDNNNEPENPERTETESESSNRDTVINDDENKSNAVDSTGKFGFTKEFAKKAFYGVASAALATVAVEVVGNWFESSKTDD